MPKQLTIDLVMAELDDNEFSPLDFLGLLRGKGLDEAEAKEAISYLINDHQVEMTEARRLRRPTVAA